MVASLAKLVWDREMDGSGIAPSPAVSSPAPDGRVSSRASSALAAVSVVLILLYLFWRSIWQHMKHARRGDDDIGATASSLSAPRLPYPSRAACGASEAGERRETTPLPVFVYVAAAGAETSECAVCLVEFGHGEAGRLVPGCGHGFHAACIETWFRVNSTCPLCRAAVVAGADERRTCGDNDV